MPILSTLRQETFARNVAEGNSYRKAAVAAGYSVRSASCLGSQLMRQPAVAGRVRELKAARPRMPITRESVLEHLAGTAAATERAVVIRDDGGVVVGLYIPVTQAMRDGGLQNHSGS
jgi:phage terminase small subunit